MKISLSITLQNWFDKHKRELPWRTTNDAYKIWLSEVILQQTRVSQGLPYYNRFLDQYPTVQDFAQATEDEILRLWQGLGYYSRGRNMLKCAKVIVENHNGVFPADYKQMVSLPGIGDYTASAILSFSYNLPFAVLDGNVFRFLARYHGISTPINTPEGIKTFKALADQELDALHPAKHNQAIMEFGALLCTPKKPNCNSCPFQESCAAYRSNQVSELPIKLKAKPRKKRYFNYLVHHTDDGRTYIQQRKTSGIWQNLYEFPLIESDNPLTIKALGEVADEVNLLQSPQAEKAFEIKHILSHQEIFAVFWVVRNSSFQINGNSNIFEVGLEELRTVYAMPVLISKFLDHVELN